MKRFSITAQSKGMDLVFIVGVLLLLIAFLLVPIAPGQKTRIPDKRVTSADLDMAGVSGAQLFYQLTDNERLITDESGRFGIKGTPYKFANQIEATKVPAEIVFDFFDRRRPKEEGGQRVYSVFVKRPTFLGGPFTKDEVHFDPGRGPGTIDFPKPGDLVN